MTSLSRLAGLIFNQPLLALESQAVTIAATFAQRFDIEAPDLDADLSRFVGRPAGPRDETGRPNGMWRIEQDVAIISILGELTHRGAWIGAQSGLVSYEGLTASLEAAAQDPSVKAIVLDIHSPGGQASGAIETGRLVAQLAQKKPIIALANAMAASAAYAIAAGASKIVVTESAAVGSIGAIFLHLDRTDQMNKSGIKPTVLRSVSHKALGSSAEALSDEAHAHLMEQILSIHSLFAAFVSERRGLSIEAIDALKGATFMGAAALAVGLADEVGTLSSVLADLNSVKPSAQRIIQGAIMTQSNKVAAQADNNVLSQDEIKALIDAAREDGETKGRAAALTEFQSLLADVFPGDARAEVVLEAIQAQVPLSVAASFAKRFGAVSQQSAAQASSQTAPLRLVPDPKVDAEAALSADEQRGAGLRAAALKITEKMKTR